MSEQGHLPGRRVLLLAGCVGYWLVLAGGCAMPSPGIRTVRLSEARVAERLARQFPYTHRHLDLLEWHLSNPGLRLIPQENRLATRLDVAVGRPGAREPQRRGSVTLSYGLRLDTDDRTLRLHELRVEELDLPGLPAPVGALTQRLTGVFMQDRFRDVVVYRLSEDDLRSARGWGYEPGDPRVVPGGLELELRPIRRP